MTPVKEASVQTGRRRASTEWWDLGIYLEGPFYNPTIKGS